eukprot:12151708-Heterocapsa_arctica.AAC.1
MLWIIRSPAPSEDDDHLGVISTTVSAGDRNAATSQANARIDGSGSVRSRIEPAIPASKR